MPLALQCNSLKPIINLFWNKLSGSKSLWDSRQIQECLLLPLSCVTAYLSWLTYWNFTMLRLFQARTFLCFWNVYCFLITLPFFGNTLSSDHHVTQWQKYHLKMLDHVLGCRNMCHVQSQNVMNQYTELESLQLNKMSSLSLHYLQR